MQLNELIRHFSEVVELPVDVNDILPVIRAGGVDAEIEFIGVDLDPEILQGQIKVFDVRVGMYGAETRRMANIYYHRGHSESWQRFICCKELLHLLDPDVANTATPQDVDSLAEKIGLPPYMQDPMADGLEANLDRIAEFRAAAILFPFAARQAFLEPLAQGRMTLDDIATLTDIPRKYVALVMSPHWEAVHKLFLAV